MQRLGNYRLEELIAQGEHASVYRAVHTLLPRRAIIKVLESAQLLREAIILEALHHPGIVRVYESGLSDQRAWFARELADGPTMMSVLSPSSSDRSRSDASRIRDRVDATRLLRDLAEILEHAHRRGIVHAGLRPSRIVLCREPAQRGFPLCITDWSDARAYDAGALAYVPCEESWPYASPELAAGDPIDDRVDVYALGVIAHQLLAGKLPQAARSADDEPQHVPTEVHCPDTPRELTTLVDQMLAYDQWDRPSSAEAHAQLSELVELLSTGPRSRRPSLVHRVRSSRWTPGVDGLDETTPPPAPPPQSPSSSNKPS